MRDHMQADVTVGTAMVDLHIPESQSLKDRRSVVSRAVAVLKNNLGASVAEVGGQDLWQRAVLACAVCAPSPAGVDRTIGQITELIERDPRVVVVRVVVAYDTHSYP